MNSDESETQGIVDSLQDILGKFYFQSHTHCPPTFLQVVGWTVGAEREDAKRRYVYVRKVPLRVNNSPSGGKWDYDYDVIREYNEEITEPVYNSNSPLVNGNAILIPGGEFLRYQSITVPEFKQDIPRPRQIILPNSNGTTSEQTI